MKIVEYNKALDIIVEFQDKYKAKVHTNYAAFLKGNVKNPYMRLGEENINNQGCLMKIIEYIDCMNVKVEFQDEYSYISNVRYDSFLKGKVKNPYHKSVCGVGMLGDKYPSGMNGVHTKEYKAWRTMLTRCFDKKYKDANPAYKNVTCCEDWYLFDNFYEWLHSQDNFKKWYDGYRWNIDKDIIVKHNKIYSPETCLLVPENVNMLFTKCDNARGDFPIGVFKDGDGFCAMCSNQITKTHDRLGHYKTQEEAFLAYKSYKESLIKQVAEREYKSGNITETCYNAMMNYEVEITD